MRNGGALFATSAGVSWRRCGLAASRVLCLWFARRACATAGRGEGGGGDVRRGRDPRCDWRWGGFGFWPLPPLARWRRPQRGRFCGHVSGFFVWFSSANIGLCCIKSFFLCISNNLRLFSTGDLCPALLGTYWLSLDVWNRVCRSHFISDCYFLAFVTLITFQ